MDTMLDNLGIRGIKSTDKKINDSAQSFTCKRNCAQNKQEKSGQC